MQVRIERPAPGEPLLDQSKITELVRDTLSKIVDAHEEKLLTFTLASSYFADGKFDKAEKYYALAKDRSNSVIKGLEPETLYALPQLVSPRASVQEGRQDPSGHRGCPGTHRDEEAAPSLQAKYLLVYLNKLEEFQLAEDVLRNCWNGYQDNQEINRLLIERTLSNRNFGKAKKLVEQYELQWKEDELIEKWRETIRSAQTPRMRVRTPSKHPEAMTENEPNSPNASLGTTIMSVIAGAGELDLAARRDHLDRFARQYGPPLVERIMSRHRVDRAQAKDLVQDFLTEKLLAPDDRNLAQTYLERRPSLRISSFAPICQRLYETLSRDRHRYDRAGKRGGGQRPLSLATMASTRLWSRRRMASTSTGQQPDQTGRVRCSS